MKVVIDGSCDAAFAVVRDAFGSNFERDLELGAALSVSVEGRNVVDIWVGYLDEQDPAWERRARDLFSCTKGVVAVLALMRVVAPAEARADTTGAPPSMSSGSR